jgi:hypothetical protein
MDYSYTDRRALQGTDAECLAMHTGRGSRDFRTDSEEAQMRQINRPAAMALAFAACGAALSVPAWADEYDDTVASFRKADASGKFFETAYGCAVFPKIAKGAGEKG